MCGVAGVLFIAIAIGLATSVPQFSGHYQLKIIVLGVVIGGTLILASVGRRVYRAVDRAGVRSGTRWLGLTRWSPRIPTTKNQVLDIGRNDDAELFVTIRRPEGATLLSIGPFVDGDQAVKASTLLSPGHKENEEDGSQVDALEMIGQLENGPPLIVPRVLMVVVFCVLLLPAWFDRTWMDAMLSMIIGVPLLLLAVVWIVPSGGVFYQTDDSESVEFWTRHRFFRRMEYRKSLVARDSPVFLRKKLHWATLGWLLMIPLYVAGVIALIFR